MRRKSVRALIRAWSSNYELATPATATIRRHPTLQLESTLVLKSKNGQGELEMGVSYLRVDTVQHTFCLGSRGVRKTETLDEHRS